VSIEAIKMETALTADRDAVVKEMFVKPGDKVAAKDLLVVLQ
jgi:pyruvate carboxylase